MPKSVSVVLHGNENCDMVKKARAWLDARGVIYDVTSKPPGAIEWEEDSPYLNSRVRSYSLAWRCSAGSREVSRV